MVTPLRRGRKQVWGQKSIVVRFEERRRRRLRRPTVDRSSLHLVSEQSSGNHRSPSYPPVWRHFAVKWEWTAYREVHILGLIGYHQVCSIIWSIEALQPYIIFKRHVHISFSRFPCAQRYVYLIKSGRTRCKAENDAIDRSCSTNVIRFNTPTCERRYNPRQQRELYWFDAYLLSLDVWCKDKSVA